VSDYPLYKVSPFKLDILKPPTEQKEWYELSPLKQRELLQKKQTELAGLPQPPQRFRLREAYKPVLNTLQIITGILNIPSASISSAVKQLIDGTPGFNAKEYFRDVFKLREQNTWSDVIGMLAEKDEDKNVWDKKWMQITSGIILDIVLDPLTYFGAGIAKSLATKGKAVREIAETGLQLSRATPQANRVYKNIMNRGFSRVWGFKLPWRTTVVPVQLPGGKAVRKTLERGVEWVEKTMPVWRGIKTTRAAEEIVPLAMRPTPMQAIVGALEKIPGFRVFEQMFVPSKTALIPVIEAKLEMMHKVGADVGDLQRQIQTMVRNKEYKGLRKILEIMEDPPYIDENIVRLTRKKAALTSRFIERYTKDDKGWQEIAREISSTNDDMGDFLTDGIKRLLTDYEGRKYLKKMGYDIKLAPKPTAQELIKETGEILDTMTARQMRAFLEKSGIKTRDISYLAKFKPEINKEKVFEKLGKELSMEQKEALFSMVDTARDWMNNWWDLERSVGLPENYVIDYFSRATGAAKGIGKPMELGGVPAFTFERLSDIPMTKRFNMAKAQLVKLGIARSKKHAEKLLRTGGVDSFGKMFDTIHEALYTRGVAHIKAMHKHQFIQQVKQWGKRIPKDELIPMGWQRVERLEELAEYAFDTDTAKYINRAISAIKSDTATNAFLKLIDKTQSWWKMLVTTINAGFHCRNMYSNHFIGWVKHGIKYFNPKSHKDGLALTLQVLYPDNPKIWKLFGISKKRLTHKYMGETIEELADKVKKYGIIRKGVRITDVPIEKGITGGGSRAAKILKKLNIAGQESVLRDVMDNIGGIIESQARGTAFLLELNNVGDIHRAARVTQEVFIDYANRTFFEREIGRRVIPFWCVPEKYRILTKDGWKYHWELETDKTEVLAYDINTDICYWKKLEGKAIFDYNGQLMKIDNGKSGIWLCTPDHKWPVFVDVDYKKPPQQKIIKTYQFRANYKIPLVANKTIWPKTSKITIKEAKIVGWLLTDGYIRQKNGNYYEYIIYQKKEPFRSEIRELLNENATESEHPQTKCGNFRINGKLRERLQEIIKNKQDAFQLLEMLNEETANTLWETMYKGDGTIVKQRKDRPNIKTDMFFAANAKTNNGKVIGEFFQLLTILLNKVCHKTQNDRGYYIREMHRFLHTDTNKIKTEWYTGKIWCPELGGLCWMMEYKGKHILTMNTWLKSNTANQVKNIFTTPARYATVGRVSKSIEALSERIPEEQRPEYFRELWAWQLPVKLPDGKPLFLNPNLPFQDLNKLDIFEWKRTLMASMTPFLKTPAELLTGYEFFREAPIERFPGYKAPVPGILQKIPEVMTENMRKTLGITKDDRGLWVMNPKVAHAITNFAPFIRNTSRMLMQEPARIPADKYFQWVSYMWGIKIKPIDPLTEQYYRTLEAIKLRKQELARAGYGI